jgi:hypothetical protein
VRQSQQLTSGGIERRVPLEQQIEHNAAVLLTVRNAQREAVVRATGRIGEGKILSLGMA